MAAALSFGSALCATAFKPAVARRARSAPVARSGLKVTARMTKDRVGLEKDAKWRQTIDIYPEWGTFPGQGRVSVVSELSYDEYKNNVSAEIIHGRFAMLAVCGVWAQENLGEGPWFMAGKECTFDSCTLEYLGNKFTPSYDGALLGLIFFEIILIGGAEGYRTGLLENPFEDVVAGSVYPGGRFDPFGFADGSNNFFKEDIDTLKIKELKHGRLAMLAWLGIITQAISTNPDGTANPVGPVANWSAHVADVVHCNVVDRSGCVF